MLTYNKNGDMMNNIKELMLKNEASLSPYATYDKEAIRLKPYKEDIRGNYFRDIDRIIYGLSYNRYIDKTQVFSINDNDHISKRMIHVQLVSKIARTIGRALSLNEDLIEAIALGHDLGHPPFGHVGEAILNDISLKYNEGYFNHNVQSVRVSMDLEKNGEGNNLTIQTLDGILAHNGEFVMGKYVPNKKTKKQFLQEYNACYKDKGVLKKIVPMTLEGCVVRISDIIGYLGRDIEDAITLGLISKNDIPKEIGDTLGYDNRSIVNTIILDVINNSLNKPYIKLSDDIYKSIFLLKDFNYKYIYNKANSKEDIEVYSKMFNELFIYYLNALNSNNEETTIYRNYLNNMTDTYFTCNSKERIVIDYIAGMTDDYFINEYKTTCKTNK